MDLLPDEILLHTFKYVPGVCRRNSIRQVCRRWYRICNDHHFTKDEEFVSSEFRLTDMCFEISRSKRDLFNVKLFSPPLYYDSAERQPEPLNALHLLSGPRMRSLTIQIQRFHDVSVIQKFVEACPNLNYFSLKIDTVEGTKEFLKRWQPKNSIPSVTVFSFKSNHVCLNNEQDDSNMEKVLSAFTNLVDLELHISFCPSIDEFSSERPIITVEYIKSVAKKLRRLRLIYPNFENPFSRAFALPELHWVLQLNDIVHIVLGLEIHNTIYTSTPNLQYLAEVTACHILYWPFLSSERFLSLIENAGNLRKLHLDGLSTEDVNERVIQKILGSKLKLLRLNFSVLNSYDVEINSNVQYANNNSLKLIDIYMDDEPRLNFSALTIPFLKHARNLRHLSISNPNDDELQTIFEYQTRLETLQLKLGDLCSDFGFTGIRKSSDEGKENSAYSIEDLKELKHLELAMHYVRISKLTKNIFEKFNLPNLELFAIAKLLSTKDTIAKKAFLRAALKSIQNMPSLTVFQFCIMGVRWYEALMECKQIPKRLQYILSCSIEKWPEVNAFQTSVLFEKFPSLRVIRSSIDELPGWRRIEVEDLMMKKRRLDLMPDGFEILSFFVNHNLSMFPAWTYDTKVKSGVFEEKLCVFSEFGCS